MKFEWSFNWGKNKKTASVDDLKETVSKFNFDNEFKFNPSDVTESYGQTSVNKLFIAIFGIIPSVVSSKEKKETKSVIENISNHKDQILHIYSAVTDGEVYRYVAILKCGLIVFFDDYNRVIVFYTLDVNNPIIKEIQNNSKKYECTKQTINFIVKGASGYQLKSTDLSERDIDIEDNYNDNLSISNKRIIENLNKEKSGIYMFHGEPGTGKSNYIRFLKTQTKKDFIFVPIEIAQHLDSPDLFTVFLANPKSVLVIEDAEKLLVSRENNQHSHLAGLLNLADGLIGQLLNIQVICTFNTTLDNVDPALLRRGRLLESYKFDKLTIGKTTNLFKKFGYKQVPKEEMVLTDIYNYEQKESELTIPQRKKIGFSAMALEE